MSDSVSDKGKQWSDSLGLAGQKASKLYDLLTEHKQGVSDIVSKAVDIHLGGILSSRRWLWVGGGWCWLIMMLGGDYNRIESNGSGDGAGDQLLVAGMSL